MKTSRLTFILIALIISAVVLVDHFSVPVVADSRWTIPTSLSIIEEGNIDLDEFGQLLQRNDFYEIEEIGGHYYSTFPVGSSILALPMVLGFKLFSGFDDSIQEIPKYTEVFISSIFVAITAVLLFLIARKRIKNELLAAVPALVFAFCTSAWSIAGSALWQHSPSMMLLALALYMIISAEETPRIIQFASLPLAFAYVVRPTNAIPIALLTIFVLFQYRRFFLRYLLWGLTVAVPFVTFNLLVYGSILSNYYLPQRLGSNSSLFEALAGNLISPSRGLFIFSPVLLFAILGMAIKIRKGDFQSLDFFLAGIIILHWIVISTFDPWWAGHSFGPRFFTDILPFLIYFLIPFVSYLGEQGTIWKKALAATFVVFALFSLIVQHRGATCEQVQDWNVHPDVYENQERLWDWSDIPYMSGIYHNLFRCEKNWSQP